MPLIPVDDPGRAVAVLLRRRGPMPGGAGPARCPERAERGDLESVPAVLAGRRSVRRFAGRALSAALLTEVLALAEASQRDQWQVDRHGHAGLRLLVGAFQVDGLEPGLHFHAAPPVLVTPSHAAPWLAELPGSYAPAPALVFVCGPVSRVDGAGYGGLQVRAGALGYAVWLAARSAGLDCSVFGATSCEISRTVHGLDPGSWHLFTVAIGYAPEPGPVPDP